MVSFCNEMHTFYNLLRDSTARHKKKTKTKQNKGDAYDKGNV